MNQECKVCGEPAAGFHFGAFTCEGCKSFFGRSYNNIGSISECKNNGECVINKKNRTSCKACRLRKCIDVGMSKSSSRYGRRSNWFKIHCLLQESRKEQKQKEPDPRLPLQIASLSRTKEEQLLLGLDPDYYKEPSTSTSSPDSVADSGDSFRGPPDMFPLIHFPYIPRYVPIPPNLFSYFRYDDNFNRTDYSPSKEPSPMTDRCPTPDSPMDLSVRTTSAPEDSSDEESITVDDLPSEDEDQDLRRRDRNPLDLTTKVL